MPRKRMLNKDKDLPKRVYWKDGAYRYLQIDENKKQKWIKLHTQKNKAIAEWARLVNEPIKVFSMNDLIDKYMVEVAPLKSEKSYKDNIKQSIWLKRFFGEFNPSAVKPVHIYQYLEERGIKAKKPAPRSANLEKALLSHIFTMAIKWGIVISNPCQNIIGLKINKKRKRYVTDDEFWAVHAIASPTMKLIMEMAWITGLRRIDILNIKKGDIIANKYLKVEISKTKLIKADPLMFVLTDGLKEIIRKAKNIKRSVSSLYLFSNKKGLRYTPDGFSTNWQKLIGKALQLGVIKEPFKFHDLRRKSGTDAARLFGKEYASNLLDHEDVRTTETHYIIKEKIVKPLR